jgi:hypothetical protein
MYPQLLVYILPDNVSMNKHEIRSTKTETNKKGLNLKHLARRKNVQSAYSKFHFLFPISSLEFLACLLKAILLL